MRGRKTPNLVVFYHMAKIYYEQLNDIVDRLQLRKITPLSIEVKHFFSGAALYLDDTICVSISPAGLAFKLAEAEVSKLIASGKALPLKYFPNGNIKKGYALFKSPELGSNKWKNYFHKAFLAQNPELNQL